MLYVLGKQHTTTKTYVGRVQPLNAAIMSAYHYALSATINGMTKGNIPFGGIIFFQPAQYVTTFNLLQSQILISVLAK